MALRRAALTLCAVLALSSAAADSAAGSRKPQPGGITLPPLPTFPTVPGFPSIPVPPGGGGGGGNCENCEVCLAVDFLDRPGELRCQECKKGFRLLNNRCFPSGGSTPTPPGGCICPAVFAPVCGDDGNDYGNECEANCDGAKVACDGSCPCPPIACPACSADPCDTATCPVAGARCRFKDCSCDAEFVDSNGVVVDCSRPTNPPTRCPPGVPEVNCFVDPCQVTTCPAFPKAQCVSNFCGGCNADFFINSGGKRTKVDCSGGGCKTDNESCREGDKCCNGGQCCICGPPVVRLGSKKPTTGRCSKFCRCPIG